MRHPTYLIALLLLCIHQSCMGIPVDTEKGVQYVYSYHGYIDTRSSACNERIGRWSITGNLTAQSFDKYWVFQLGNLKTSLFNGPRYELDLSHDEDIPKESEVLKQPFTMSATDIHISVASNEPLWSVNLKRSIASNFHKLEEGEAIEKSVFGYCEVFYDVKDKSNVVKTIKHETCKDKPYKHKTNTRRAPHPKIFKPIQQETVVNIKPDSGHLQSIHSVSRVTYKSMPKPPNTQHVDQHLELDLISTSTEFKHINIEELTEQRKIFYEYGDDPTSGRHKYETDSKVLAQQFLDNYEIFETKFEEQPIKNHQNTTDDPMESMFDALYYMPDEHGFIDLRQKIKNKKNSEMFSFFITLLPYIGTSQSVKYINDIILKGDLEHSTFHIINLLATFPKYMDELSNEVVQSLEGFLNVKDVKSDAIRSGQILSFASILERSIVEKSISQENQKKYTALYHDRYLGSEDYEEKMMYLLGLINMAAGLPIDFIIPIITNTSEDANLRSLALAGFKNRLVFSKNDYFNIFWPMVQDKQENFDVRVGALDLLLATELTEDQFNTILGVYKKYQKDDIHGKHLANYFRTTIESFEYSFAYWNPNAKYTLDIVENETFPIFSRPWTTSNYRIFYSDDEPNIGGYFQAQLIANPVLNTISTAILSFDSYALSFNSDTYTVYLKLHGIMEYFYKDHFFQEIPKDTTLPELIKLIKEFDFKMRKTQQDIHCDCVIFVGDKAVYAATFNNKDHKKHQEKVKNISNVVESMVTYMYSVSLPVMDYTYIPSVLGTPINILNDMQQITGSGYSGNDLVYRSSWSFQTWLEAYNPILDTTVASYKYYGDEKGLRTRASFNVKMLTAGWVIKNDTFCSSFDKLIGTAVVHEDILKRFCPDCDAMHEIPTDLVKHDRMKDFKEVGFYINYTLETNDEGYISRAMDDEFKNFLPTHFSNVYTFPYAKPFLTLLHFIRNRYYFTNELQRGSIRSIPADKDGIQTTVKLDWEGVDFSYTADPFKDTHYNYTYIFANKKLSLKEEESKNEEDFVSITKMKLQLMSYYETDEHGNNKITRTQNTFFHMHIDNEIEFDICSSRIELLPTVRSDKFSLVPTEDTTATNIIHQDDSNDTLYTCSDNNTITLTETFQVTEESNKKVKESVDYKECQKESKGLKFTPPTSSCMAAFIAGSQYNDYKVNAEFKNITEFDGTDLAENYLFAASRVGDNEVKFKFLVTPFVRVEPNDEKYVEYTSYYPYQTKNPAADVYGDNDIISGFKRSCVVTPKRIRSFTGHNVPIDGSKQVAFVECFENAMRGMTIEKIDNTHVGFKFWSKKHTVDATVHNNKLVVSLNGDKLQESYLRIHDRISVRFLDEDVVLIADEKVSIYYNTEYIYIKANPIYNDLICGVCSTE